MTPTRILIAAACIIMQALALAGCSNTTGRVRLDLAPIPEDLRACARRYVPPPAGDKPLTQREVVALIGRLKASEEAKSGCLARLIALYESQAEMVREALK
ncbi:hypothetical protein [Xanthobacter sp. YC-JY1]|uniref:hypothetical protein n=1 Tax=Xanthobacter sp. YC-JY1 TaxID=2419844 RepID=UPI001F1F4670|nr:hypothetical protein [Xanthobacter sp. YC-JY1]UJX46654.1 hypothetical protein D7006_19395 [Xanthobacter sp. YC-JY1]